MIEFIQYQASHQQQLELFKSDKLSFDYLSDKDGKLIPIVIAAKTIVKNGKVVGAGFLKIVPEAIIIINPDLSKAEKGEILDAAFLEAKMEVEKFGLDGIHIFTYEDSEFDKVLMKRYKFVDAGKCLYLEL